MRRLLFLLGMSMMLTACGASEQPQANTTPQPQEIDIYYQADDGEYNPEYSYDVYDNIVAEDPKEDIKNGKTIITLAYCGEEEGNDQMDFWVTAFNRENDKYYVEHTPYAWGLELADTQTRLNIEIGSGKGPDILTTGVFPLTTEHLEKGMFVDLAPYLVASGITEDKYYSAYKAFEVGDKVYGIVPNVEISMVNIDTKVLGGYEVPDIETLVNKLWEYPEEVAFMPYGDAGTVLSYFLIGSEDIWGMVDWEQGKCDFSGELFSRMLDVSKRYGDNCQKGCEPLLHFMSRVPAYYEGQKALKAQGKVLINFYFDEGNFPIYDDSAAFVINANTEVLEGAWAFLSFVMSKQGQGLNFLLSPVHKELSYDLLKEEFALIEAGKHYVEAEDGQQVRMELADDVDVLLEELTSLYDNGHRLPDRTGAILDIIFEETGSYFSGDKSKEDVIRIIESRVNLYLSELE